ncbi:MAG: radical SAM protein [Verrucomicrobia bacterium]|nr:radical SAM protein [Verrucomicrobiota bacterium]
MKRLLLISPVARSSLVGKDFNFRLPLLGLLKVASLTPSSWQVTIQDERVEPLGLEEDADLVGITTMTTTAPRAYEIADHFRRRGIKVAMGGMHVSALPAEALQHCDSVVVGEAEALWPRLLADFEQRSLQPIYHLPDGFPSLENLPLPTWELYRDKRYLPVHFVETTRGCPLDCEFCAVTTAFGGHYRNRPLEEVIAELRSLRPFEGRFILKNCVFFVDDNIISNRAYARELLPRLAEFKLKWFSQASMNIAKDAEVLKLCKRSGCIGLFIGFESLSEENLRTVGKRVNHPKDYLEAVQRIHDHGIGIDASFVFGLDADDEGVFDRALAFVERAKIEVAFYSILTPYPGTRLHQRLTAENRILTEDWSLYDSSHVVYRPRTFTPDQLLAGYYRVLKEAFSLGTIVRRLWGTTAYKPFFYPMNFGFRHSARALCRAYQAGRMEIPAAANPG